MIPQAADLWKHTLEAPKSEPCTYPEHLTFLRNTYAQNEADGEKWVEETSKTFEKDAAKLAAWGDYYMCFHVSLASILCTKAFHAWVMDMTAHGYAVTVLSSPGYAGSEVVVDWIGGKGWRGL